MTNRVRKKFLKKFDRIRAGQQDRVLYKIYKPFNLLNGLLESVNTTRAFFGENIRRIEKRVGLQYINRRLK